MDNPFGFDAFISARILLIKINLSPLGFVLARSASATHVVLGIENFGRRSKMENENLSLRRFWLFDFLRSYPRLCHVAAFLDPPS
jgi:hypothetical protein